MIQLSKPNQSKEFPMSRLRLEASADCVLHLAERVWSGSVAGSEINRAAETVLLAGLRSVLDDADGKGVVDGSGNSGCKVLGAPAPQGGSSDGRSGLGQLNTGLKSGHVHGSVPCKEGSDKSARAVRTRSGRRLSIARKSGRKQS